MIGDFVNLEVLNLNANLISLLPESLANLCLLETLSFSNNLISIMPIDIVYLPNLSLIDLSGNLLESIPSTICNIPSCIYDFSENMLCEEYHFNCIDINCPDEYSCWGEQDNSNCDCNGVTGGNIFDSDNDGICDDLDSCPFDEENDIDSDGSCADDDPCPYDFLDDLDNDGR